MTNSENRAQERLTGLMAENAEAVAAVEALLFVASEPVETGVIAAALGVPVDDVERAVDSLAAALRRDRRGLMIQRSGDQVQLVTAPRFGPLVDRFLEVERKVRFSDAALETLAIIAYRQPVTRAEIEAIRGVDCSGVLATLVAREMIEIVGRRSTAGNPMVYETTDAFLRQFGISSLDELPNEDQDQR